MRGFDLAVLAPLAVRVLLPLSASLNIVRPLAGIIRAWSQCHNWALILLCEKGEAFIAEADIKKKNNNKKKPRCGERLPSPDLRLLKAVCILKSSQDDNGWECSNVTLKRIGMILSHEHAVTKPHSSTPCAKEDKNSG